MSLLAFRKIVLILFFCLLPIICFGVKDSYALPFFSILDSTDESIEDSQNIETIDASSDSFFDESDGKEDFIFWGNSSKEKIPIKKSNKKVIPHNKIQNQDYKNLDLFMESDGGEREEALIPTSTKSFNGNSNKKDLTQVKFFLFLR